MTRTDRKALLFGLAMLVLVLCASCQTRESFEHGAMVEGHDARLRVIADSDARQDVRLEKVERWIERNDE